MSKLEKPSVDFFSVQRDYWRQVNESQGFDLENVSIPSNVGGITGLMPYDCVRTKSYPFPVMVNLYAKVGLHRYNILKGTNFKLDSLVKFNMLQNCVSSFYMTLLAHDPAPDHPLETTFQVRVDEQRANFLDFECSIARIKDEVIAKKRFVPHFLDAAEEEDFYRRKLLEDSFFKGALPDWPSDDALNDGKRFYLVKESEWQANDWIYMYLELVICAHDRMIQKRDVLSQLEILEVAIETGVEDVEPPNERLKAKSVNVYIKFKGIANVIAPRMIFEISEHVERKAVVRRVLHEHSGNMTLSGKFCGGQSTHNQPSVALQNGKKIQSCKKRPRSD